MNKLIASLVAATLLAGSLNAVEYPVVPDWLKLPESRTQLGNMHGDVAVSSKGDVYVSVQDPRAGLQVFAPDGHYLRNVPDAPADFHGFVIHKDRGGEFLYGPSLGGQRILKMTLDGKVVLDIPATAIPDSFKNKREGKPFVLLTGMDVAPNGDLYVTDGYSSDYVHRFDATGKYITSFGGRKAPYNFQTLHKIAIDNRFKPARIIGCDRANNRIVHMSLDGEFIGVIAKDLLLPAAVAIHGNYAAVGELKGEISVFDKSGKLVARFGVNTNADEVGTNKTPPSKWRQGIVTAPHGVAFNKHGDLFVSEFSEVGRVHRFNRK